MSNICLLHQQQTVIKWFIFSKWFYRYKVPCSIARVCNTASIHGQVAREMTPSLGLSLHICNKAARGNSASSGTLTRHQQLHHIRFYAMHPRIALGQWNCLNMRLHWGDALWSAFVLCPLFMQLRCKKVSTCPQWLICGSLSHTEDIPE